MNRWWILLLLMLVALPLGCGDDDDDDDSSNPQDDDDDDNDDDTTDDDTSDDDDDDVTTQCEEGEVQCSFDASAIETCQEGQWVVTTDCLADMGGLCQAPEIACVDPWTYDNPTFDDCAGDPDATAMNLLQKAEKYDLLAETLHIHPDDKRLHHVTLAPGYTEANATWENVIDWNTGENDGLWTGLYIASQAFRYATTKDAQALDNLEMLMDGMRIGMEITGVDGLFTREYITPGVTGMSCPADLNRYIPDPEKDDNQWVKVDSTGHILTYDGADWVQTSHTVPVEFADYCWLDNVSQDEYAGHMLALGLVFQLVDDPDIHDLAGDLLERVGQHLLDNEMALQDWDGRLVEHGRFWPTAFDNFPGYNSILGLSYMKLATVASGREDFLDFYDNCLLQKKGPNDCLSRPLTPPISYADWLWFIGLYIGPDNCKGNWNNFGMAFAGMFPLIWYERDPLLRPRLQYALENYMFYNRDNGREMSKQANSAWAMMYASMKNVGPGSTGQDITAVNDAICSLRKFPESKTKPTLDVGDPDYPIQTGCISRLGREDMTIDPVPVNLRCPANFAWWANPYHQQSCTADPQYVRQPGDYLLAYWMGRYFGYIDEMM